MGYVIGAIALLIVGSVVGWLLIRRKADNLYKAKLAEAKREIERLRKDARREADALEKEKMKELKQKFQGLKEELERETKQRNSAFDSRHTKLKRREEDLNERQCELEKKNGELDAVREMLTAQQDVVEHRQEELNELIAQQRNQLEHIGGLSATEAKEQLIETMRAEAQDEATAYVNEIVEEAKMTANKEAKRIVVQSIQRVATETAIENSVSVFHIDNDEIKGRIIGREGRNIRALEAATGIEIIVDCALGLRPRTS